MTHRLLALVISSVFLMSGCGSKAVQNAVPSATDVAVSLAADGVVLAMEGEIHLKNMRQLTAGGDPLAQGSGAYALRHGRTIRQDQAG